MNVINKSFDTKNKGFSLIALVIAIIIMIIISGTAIYTLSSLNNNSIKVAFGKDLAAVKDGIDEYYVVYGDIPASTASSSYSLTASEYETLVSSNFGEKYLSSLTSEINNNGDRNDTFYEVDLRKIGVKSTLYGARTDNDDYDVYLVTLSSRNVYYLKGIKVSGKIYYSILSLDFE